MAFGYGVYFTERERNRVVRWDPDSGATDIVAGEPAGEDPSQKLSDPYGLVFETAGKLLITDKHHSRVVRLQQGRLEELPLKDLDGHRNKKQTSPLGFNPFPISTPSGIFVEKSKRLLVSFHDDGTLYRIYPDGRLELVLGMVWNRNYHHTGPEEDVPPSQVADTPLFKPTGVVARADGTIYVIERGYQVLREYRPGQSYRSLFPISRQMEWVGKTPGTQEIPISEYACVYPGSVALDAEERLYLTEVRQRCIVAIDLQKGTVRRVMESRRPVGGELRGVSALGFGPDGTAWVMDGAAGVLEGYSTDPGKPWTPLGVAIREIMGQPLGIATGGAGIAIGN